MRDEKLTAQRYCNCFVSSFAVKKKMQVAEAEWIAGQAFSDGNLRRRQRGSTAHKCAVIGRIFASFALAPYTSKCIAAQMHIVCSRPFAFLSSLFSLLSSLSICLLWLPVMRTYGINKSCPTRNVPIHFLMLFRCFSFFVFPSCLEFQCLRCPLLSPPARNG